MTTVLLKIPVKHDDKTSGDDLEEIKVFRSELKYTGVQSEYILVEHVLSRQGDDYSTDWINNIWECKVGIYISQIARCYIKLFFRKGPFEKNNYGGHKEFSSWQGGGYRWKIRATYGGQIYEINLNSGKGHLERWGNTDLY